MRIDRFNFNLTKATEMDVNLADGSRDCTVSDTVFGLPSPTTRNYALHPAVRETALHCPLRGAVWINIVPFSLGKQITTLKKKNWAVFQSSVF